MRLALPVALCLCLAGGALAAPKVAFVYSSWSNYTFRDEFDAHLQKLGWACEKFENTDLGKLVPRLAEFDVVIAGGVANYEHTVDLAPYQAQWLQWLRGGGLLLITDASYGSVLDLWTNRLGEGFTLGTQTCARHTRQGPNPDRQDFDAADTVLYTPRDLASLLKARANVWAHLVPRAPGWRSLVTCADNQSLFVYQDVEQGCVAVTSYFAFKGPASEPVVGALLDNLWAHVQGLRSGVAVQRFALGPALPGTHSATVTFRNSLPAATTYRVSLAVTEAGQAAPATTETTATVPAGGQAELRLPYTLTRREAVRLALRIQAGERQPLELSRQLVVPPLVTLAVPNRHTYPWQAELPWSGALAPEAGVKLADLTADLVLDGRMVASFPAPASQLAGQADLRGLPLGEHKLELRLRQGDRPLGAVSQGFTTHPTPRIYVRPSDLTTMVDGKPFFPLGFYHVSWPFPAEDRLQFLREVAAAGYNTVHASLKQMDEWDPFLAEAEKLNVKVITEFGVDMTAAIKRYHDRRAVLAWNPGDEPDGGGVPPEVMLERHNQIKSADWAVPTYMTLCVPAAYQRYAAMAEVIAPDPYPIRHASASTVPVYNLISQAVAAATPLGRPIWAIPQAFGYENPASWRVPTFAEERNMTYLALLAGAKGLIYYTYRDSGFDMRQHPELWDGMKTLPAEIKALEPWLLEGTREKLETGLPDVFAGHWVSGARQAVVVANTATEARSVALSLPAGVGGRAVNLFPTRPATLQVTAGKLSGSLGPLEVQVYEVR